MDAHNFTTHQMPSSLISTMETVVDHGTVLPTEANTAIHVASSSTVTSQTTVNHIKNEHRQARMYNKLSKTLPPGWTRTEVQRKQGKKIGRWNVRICSPSGDKFSTKTKLAEYFVKHNLKYDLEDFDFKTTSYYKNKSDSIDPWAALGKCTHYIR